MSLPVEISLRKLGRVKGGKGWQMPAIGHPGLRHRVLTDQGEVREHVNLFVDKECVRYGKGLAAEIHEGAEISVIPAITGGSAGR